MRSSAGSAANRRGYRRQILRQPIARIEPDVVTLFVREQANAVELALEEPLRSGEPILRQGRGHWLEPLGSRHTRGNLHDAAHAGTKRANSAGKPREGSDDGDAFGELLHGISELFRL